MGQIRSLEFAEGTTVTAPTDLVVGGSGSGEINTIINPNGATALDGGRTNDVGDWIDSGTGTTSSVTTTAADIPLYPVVETAIKILNDGSSTGYTRCRYTLPKSLYNRKLKISWEQFVSTSTAYVSGDYKVQLYSNAAADYSGAYTEILTSSASSGVTSIAAANGRFQTTYDNSTAPYLELRITRVAGAANSYICLNDVIIGPGIQPQGAVVGPWLSYTPVLKGATNGSTFTNQTTTGIYRRVGDTLEFEVSTAFSGAPGTGTGAFLWTVPTGLTIDSSKIVSNRFNGSVYIYNATEDADSGIVGQGYVMVSADASVGFRAIYLESATNSDYLSATHPEAWQSGDTIKMVGSFPIAEWAGSGTVNLASGDSMGSPFVYTFTAWNPSGTGDVTDGATAGTVSVSNSDMSAALAAEVLTVTVNRAGYYLASTNMRHAHGNAYTTAIFYSTIGGTATSYGSTQSGTTDLGAGIDASDSNGLIATSWIVHVASPGQTVTFKPEFRSNGISSTAQHTANVAFMMQPLSAIGQAVGFGEVNPGTSSGLVSASGLKGSLGTTIGSGYVGEVLPFTSRAQTTPSTGAWASNSSALTTLTPGNWLLMGTYTFASTTGANNYRAVLATNSTNDSSGAITGAIGATTMAAVAAASADPILHFSAPYSVTTSTPIYMKVFTEDASVSMTVGGYAIRLP